MDEWNETSNKIADKFGFIQYDFESLFTEEKEVEDVTGNYEIYGLGTFNFKFMDSMPLITGITYFRPYIRGLIILLCVFFNIRQAQAFFGLNSGEIQSYGNASRGRDQ